MKNASLDIDYGNDLKHVIVNYLNNGDMGDDYESDGQGSGMVRFGKRIYYWNDLGSDDLDSFDTVRAAQDHFWKVQADYYHSTCEKCGEKVHNDEMSQYDHDRYECEPPRPPRMDRNDNGSWYCNDCHKVVILFDDDEHDCDVTQTSSAVHAASEPGLLDEFRQAERIIGTE